MVYTIEQIQEKIIPLAEKYNLSAVYLFGSYARVEPAIKNLVKFGGPRGC